eukprot:gnl/TRDRNA2_/TRDRNA2_184128_c0_seq1.p1 gnl/TRDRNA2_/TRDRNA2_184128_c0~~gnl/TRDRNA2_/TRDRNA2_184128_c0_seq1.p1  ORF type:complete len:340 (-),score=47.12 gnl/TRDRNA2_/TRDRNA2_184128_c0_seq1:398-1417(-)
MPPTPSRRSGMGMGTPSPSSQAERPRMECLFPSLEKVSPSGVEASPPRGTGISRASRSEPSLPFCGKRDAGSELSAVTTAFVGGSQAAASTLSANSVSTEAYVQAMRASRVDDMQKRFDELGTHLVHPVHSPAAAGPEGSPSRPLPKCSRPGADWSKMVPYEASVVSSNASDWRLQYWRECGMGVRLERGLVAQDLRYCTENSPGVCAVKPAELPPVPRNDKAADIHRKIIMQTNNALRQMKPEDPFMARICEAAANSGQQPISEASAPAASMKRATSEVSLEGGQKDLRKHRDRFQTWDLGVGKLTDTAMIKSHKDCTVMSPPQRRRSSRERMSQPSP